MLFVAEVLALACEQSEESVSFSWPTTGSLYIGM